MTAPESPMLPRSHSLVFNGDWGGANFHRICSWLSQEFCDRAGPASRVSIRNWCDGGASGVKEVNDGYADLCIFTPAMLAGDAIKGRGIFSERPLPHLRALAVIPQDDRIALAINKKFGVSTFEELRTKKPALKIATSVDDGTNPIGYIAGRYLEAHGLSQEIFEAWGGSFVTRTRPEESLFLMQDGEVDAVLQEAMMAPWWQDVMADENNIMLPAEESALETLSKEHGWRRNDLPKGYFSSLKADTPALDFSDFVIVVRDDMPARIAHLLTWCLVETKSLIENQYRHIPADRSPVSYPFDPVKMARTPIPLHSGARRYYRDAGYLQA